MGINLILESSINPFARVVMTQCPPTRHVLRPFYTITLETRLGAHEPSAGSSYLNHSTGESFPAPDSAQPSLSCAQLTLFLFSPSSVHTALVWWVIPASAGQPALLMLSFSRCALQPDCGQTGKCSNPQRLAALLGF